MTALEEYRRLEGLLLAEYRRKRASGAPDDDITVEQERLLNEMDPAWWKLTDEERDLIDGESPIFNRMVDEP